jgi:hypothetical protein
MERPVDMERTALLWPMRVPSGLPAIQRALRWLLGLPESLGVAIIVVALFSAAVLTLAAIYGAPLSFPRERVSIALGFSAALPVSAAIVLYLSLRLIRMVTRRGSPSGPPLLRMVATDLTLMGLFLVATYFHFNLKTWVQIINPQLFDGAYFAVDRELRPVIDLFNWIRVNVLTLVPSTDAWYQAAFLLMFIGGFCNLAITRHPVYPRFCVGVLLTICLGALSYMVAPALGPFIYEQGLNQRATEAQAGMLWAHQQVKQEGMAWIAKAGPAYFTGALAAMPSLHIAHAAVMTWFIFQARSPLMPIFVVILFWVMIESVASRWHYLIDLPAGALLAAGIVWLTDYLCRFTQKAGRPDSGTVGDI